MNEIVNLDVKTLKAMNTRTLYKELEDFLAVTAKAMTRAAYIWRELERRGEDLTDFKKKGLCAFLPMIADGKLLPEIVIQLNGSKTAISHVSRLLPEAQKAALLNGELEIVRDSGSVERVKLEHISPREWERSIDARAGKLIPAKDQVASRTTTTSSAPRNKSLGLNLTIAEFDAIAEKARQVNVGMASWVVDHLKRTKAFK